VDPTTLPLPDELMVRLKEECKRLRKEKTLQKIDNLKKLTGLLVKEEEDDCSNQFDASSASDSPGGDDSDVAYAEMRRLLMMGSPLDSLTSLIGVPPAVYSMGKMTCADAEDGGSKRVPFLPPMQDQATSMCRYPALSLCEDRETVPPCDGMLWCRSTYPRVWPRPTSSRDPLSPAVLLQLVLREGGGGSTGSPLQSFLSSSLFFKHLQATSPPSYTYPSPHYTSSPYTFTPLHSSSSTPHHNRLLRYLNFSDYFVDPKKPQYVNVNPSTSILCLPNYSDVFLRPKARRISHMWGRVEKCVLERLYGGEKGVSYSDLESMVANSYLAEELAARKWEEREGREVNDRIDAGFGDEN
jgi:hypothetical protein